MFISLWADSSAEIILYNCADPLSALAESIWKRRVMTAASAFHTYILIFLRLAAAELEVVLLLLFIETTRLS
jgi:hypothetical protein